MAIGTCKVYSEQSVAANNGDLVQWSGRTVSGDQGGVSFDWLGVTARVAVQGASYVTTTVTSTAPNRGTRLKAYTSDQNFLLYPEVQFWVKPTTVSSQYDLWLGKNSSETRVITVENIVAPQYQTGVTTVHSFQTDGTFVPLSLDQRLGGPQARRIEFIGDSITAATNVVRPAGAPPCGDGGYQSDWSQTYEGLLCHHFNADCSTVAVGGKCVMHECGGLQMPDYFPSILYANAPNRTYDFSHWAPDAMFIDLGTNDMRAITKLKEKGMGRFAEETVAFMVNATRLYSKADIQFFLSAGPMENSTMPGTLAAIRQATKQGLKATFVDMRAACASSRLHAPDDSDHCDGCAGHPGVEGHRGMYEAAWPVLSRVMGWGA